MKDPTYKEYKVSELELNVSNYTHTHVRPYVCTQVYTTHLNT